MSLVIEISDLKSYQCLGRSLIDAELPDYVDENNVVHKRYVIHLSWQKYQSMRKMAIRMLAFDDQFVAFNYYLCQLVNCSNRCYLQVDNIGFGKRYFKDLNLGDDVVYCCGYSGGCHTAFSLNARVAMQMSITQYKKAAIMDASRRSQVQLMDLNIDCLKLIHDALPYRDQCIMSTVCKKLKHVFTPVAPVTHLVVSNANDLRNAMKKHGSTVKTIDVTETIKICEGLAIYNGININNKIISIDVSQDNLLHYYWPTLDFIPNRLSRAEADRIERSVASVFKCDIPPDNHTYICVRFSSFQII